MQHCHWRKAGKSTWEVWFSRTFLGYVRREYRIGRGRRFYSVSNVDGQHYYPWPSWERIAEAARFLAVMESGRIVQDLNLEGMR